MSMLNFARAEYAAIRERLRTDDPDLDEQTLADTVEGLTNLHEILSAVVRSALEDEALALGLKDRIHEMQARLERLTDRASKRRQIAREAMVDAHIKKIVAPDFTLSVRPGSLGLHVIDETTIPQAYWVPLKPRLNRQALLDDLKSGAVIEGVNLSNSGPVLSVRTK